MIEFASGDMLAFTLTQLEDGEYVDSRAVALVNPVNCAGTMGAGLAAQFKREFPRNFERYRHACMFKRMRIGRVYITYEEGHFIVNFPTKDHWREKSKLEYIERGLTSLVAELPKHDIRSIAIPALGCGLGGLKWSDVLPLIERAACAMPDVRVIVFAPKEKA